jgi:CrcB protein
VRQKREIPSSLLTFSPAHFLTFSCLSDRWGATFPYATFVVNISGSFVLGLFITLITERYIVAHSHLRLLISIGFLGAYTTFSTFEYETFALAEAGSYFHALLNVALSVLVGFIAVWLGA